MSAREGFRLAIPHAKDCYLAERNDYFWFIAEPNIDWDLNKNGVGKGGAAFYRFRCNDPQCPAILRVRLDVLSGWLL